MNRYRLRQGLLLAGVVCLGIAIALAARSRTLQRRVYPFPYQELISTQAAAYGQDPFLVAAVVKRESRFSPQAVSPKGARGLMQLMPGTAQWVAERIGLEDFVPDDLFDPGVNVRLGSWYLMDLHREFSNDVYLVLAAYNGGRQNVKNWVAAFGGVSGSELVDRIPFPETRRYVRLVLADRERFRLLYSEGRR
ncbi:MAG: lytic transglycosylase domain-containing protein [Bacillota bacterium]